MEPLRAVTESVVLPLAKDVQHVPRTAGFVVAAVVS